MLDARVTETVMSLIATKSSRIRELPIKDGQLVFIQDLGRIAFDFNGKRVFYNQIVQLDTDAERLALEAPLNGYYFIIDEGRLWFYQDEWIPSTGAPQEVLFIGVELPQLGQKNTLYVDKDDKEISVWDEESQAYITVANYTAEVSSEDIESLFD